MTPPPDWKDDHAPASPVTEHPPASVTPTDIRPSAFARAIDAVALLQISAQRARHAGLVADLERILADLRDARARIRGEK